MAKLTEQIRAELTAAMKARDAEKLSTLRMLQSAMKYQQIDAGHELSDEEALTVIRKAQYEKGNRPELAAKERAEMVMLQAYLPPDLTDDEIESGVREIIASTGAASKKDMGKVMKEATGKYRGLVDGKKIQEIVSRLLP